MENKLVIILLICAKFITSEKCEQVSVTTASGSFARKNEFCRGELIFEDNFDELNLRKWQHEVSLTGSAVS